ncbi:MAG: hypothetical protein LBI67_06940, partial [Treponema sp.]|nr:hypothetical protein [Treponema sp.]
MMKKSLFFVLGFGFVLLAAGMVSCSGKSSGGSTETVPTVSSVAAVTGSQKTFNVNGSGKVVGVASQHMGNAWNKNSVQAIKDSLES